MRDASELYSRLTKHPEVEYSVLVPNELGFHQAEALGIKDVAVFTAASESFSRQNTNCSLEESLGRALRVRELCREHNMRTRGYISCVAGCPYEGEIAPVSVARIAERLLEAGCYEVSLGDTIGVGTPRKIGALLKELGQVTGGELWRFAGHFHDTYGQALANVCESLRQGIRVFDSSVAGLGGCPYAPGATGNLPTEDLLYLLHGQGMDTGVDLEKLVKVGHFVSQELAKDNRSKVGAAFAAKERARNRETRLSFLPDHCTKLDQKYLGKN